MEQKIKTFILENQMIEKEDILILGLSGGPDSVCLFHVMEKLKEEFKAKLVCVHVNHLLRKEEADQDESFVKELCKKAGVPLEIERVDVKAFKNKEKLSEEEAGRIIRRRAFERARKKYKGQKILLAHHADDNAETLLLNLARGCMEEGLEGIRPKQEHYIRPLLGVRKKEIIKFLEENQYEYRLDATNQENDYARNRIRNNTLVYLENEVNKQVVAHMNEAMKRMVTINQYLKDETQKYYDLVVEEKEGIWWLQKSAYEKVPEALQSRIIYQVLVKAAQKEKDITKKHIDSLMALFTKEVGKEINLPYGVFAYKKYEGIILKVGRKTANKPKKYEVKQRVFAYQKEQDSIPDSRYTKWFDYDIIKKTIDIRHRKPGDYLTINKEGNTKKLKKFFIDEKIGEEERDLIWLVCEGSQVMWVVGYRQNPHYQISNSTKKILEIKFTEDFNE
ncbi:MAG TPA: tRNA lysidine(34) synthetase TilS [Candidatus Dorea intestinavium]|nr:tRNA lysidine(34) synthetase TilS [Candidatus Dorea intestinavium]